MRARTRTLVLIASLTAASMSLVVGCDKASDDSTTAETSGAEASAEQTGDETAEPQDEDQAEENAEAGADDEPSAASAAVAEQTPFAKYDLEAVAESWQGSWVLPGSTVGQRVAWKVDGAEVTVFDGKEEKTLDFQISAPCSLSVTETKDGSRSSTHKTFAVGDSKIFAGLGDAGVLTEKGAVVCTGGKIYELSDATCSEWKERFGKWESSEATCSLQDGTFAMGAKKLETSDGALVNSQMKRNEVRPFETYEQAKAALEEPKASAK